MSPRDPRYCSVIRKLKLASKARPLRVKLESSEMAMPDTFAGVHSARKGARRRAELGYYIFFGLGSRVGRLSFRSRLLLLIEPYCICSDFRIRRRGRRLDSRR